MAAAEDPDSDSRDDSYELHEGIDKAVDKILDQKYSEAYEILSQTVDTAEAPEIDRKYRDSGVLMNYLETDIATKLSMAAHEDTAYGKELEEIENDLQEFANEHCEKED